MDDVKSDVAFPQAIRSRAWICLCCSDVHRFAEPLQAPSSCVCGSLMFEPDPESNSAGSRADRPVPQWRTPSFGPVPRSETTGSRSTYWYSQLTRKTHGESET